MLIQALLRTRSRAPQWRHDPLLEAVIAQERISLVFQPQLDCRSGAVVGVEALVRWRRGGSPEKLFERARVAGLAEPLSRLAQRLALREAAAWEGTLRNLPVSINLLPQDLARPGYEVWLLDEMARAGIDPRRVTVEITESALLHDKVRAAERLRRLKDHGVRVALDDFGTGYASLAYLVDLPIDTLKVDRGLVGRMGRSVRSRIVVRSTLRLAQELGLRTIAEGVETAEQLRMLCGWGCEVYQGFHGAAALEPEELRALVDAIPARAA